MEDRGETRFNINKGKFMKVVFDGEQTDLGRFGTVTRGDVLELSAKEADHVKGDARFVLHGSEEAKKIKPEPIKVPHDINETIEAEADREHKADTKAGKEKNPSIADRVTAKRKAWIEATRQRRGESLSRENAPGRTLTVELQGMTREALLRRAEEIKLAGKPISFLPDASKKSLIAAIKSALGEPLTDDEKGGE